MIKTIQETSVKIFIAIYEKKIFRNELKFTGYFHLAK